MDHNMKDIMIMEKSMVKGIIFGVMALIILVIGKIIS